MVRARTAHRRGRDVIASLGQPKVVVMLALGFSLNLLTMLAIVLSVGTYAAKGRFWRVALKKYF